MAYDYSHAEWDSLHDHLRDVLCEDISKLSASAAGAFCEWIQVGIDVYIHHCMVSIRSNLTRLHVFQQLVLLPWFIEIKSKLKFRQISTCYKRVLEAAKLLCTTKVKESLISQKLGYRNFWGIAGSVVNKGKSAIPPLFSGPEVLSSASDKGKLFAKNFFKNSYLDDSGISLPIFHSTA